MLSWLARSDATVASVNLEDLWLERERQNLPGSPAGTESWQRRFARDFESFSADRAVRELVDIARGAAEPAHAGASAPCDTDAAQMLPKDSAS
jgi:4-alpha-glucanotransferase